MAFPSGSWAHATQNGLLYVCFVEIQVILKICFFLLYSDYNNLIYDKGVYVRKIRVIVVGRVREKKGCVEVVAVEM